VALSRGQIGLDRLAAVCDTLRPIAGFVRAGMRSMSRFARGHFVPAIVIVVAVSLGTLGCGKLNLRGKGFDDNSGSWAQKLRPPADESRFSGMDERSRDIERNLGVR
jgi:hypothetical protein